MPSILVCTIAFVICSAGFFMLGMPFVNHRTRSIQVHVNYCMHRLLGLAFLRQRLRWSRY